MPGSDYTVASGINDRGQIAGTYRDGEGNDYRGFVDNNGAFTTIAVPGAIDTNVLGINNLGEVVGYYQNSSGGMHGFAEKNGVFSTIDVPGALGTTVTGINDFGEIVGLYEEGRPGGINTYGFVDRNGTLTTINIPGLTQFGNDSGPCINDFGQISASGFFGSSNVLQGFLATPVFLHPAPFANLPSSLPGDLSDLIAQAEKADLADALPVPHVAATQLRSGGMDDPSGLNGSIRATDQFGINSQFSAVGFDQTLAHSGG